MIFAKGLTVHRARRNHVVHALVHPDNSPSKRRSSTNFDEGRANKELLLHHEAPTIKYHARKHEKCVRTEATCPRHSWLLQFEVHLSERLLERLAEKTTFGDLERQVIDRRKKCEPSKAATATARAYCGLRPCAQCASGWGGVGWHPWKIASSSSDVTITSVADISESEPTLSRISSSIRTKIRFAAYGFSVFWPMSHR